MIYGSSVQMPVFEYSNHAEKPNCNFTIGELAEDVDLQDHNPYNRGGFFKFYTTQAIEKGTELSISYGNFIMVSTGLRNWGFFPDKKREVIFFTVSDLIQTGIWLSEMSKNGVEESSSKCEGALWGLNTKLQDTAHTCMMHPNCTVNFTLLEKFADLSLTGR